MAQVTPEQAYAVWRDLGPARSTRAAARTLATQGHQVSAETIRRWTNAHGWEARLIREGVEERAARITLRVSLDEMQSSVDALEALNRAVIEAATRATNAMQTIRIASVGDVARLMQIAGDTARTSIQSRDALARLIPLLRGDDERAATNSPAEPAGVIDLSDVRRLLGRPRPESS